MEQVEFNLELSIIVIKQVFFVKCIETFELNRGFKSFSKNCFCFSSEFIRFFERKPRLQSKRNGLRWEEERSATRCLN